MHRARFAFLALLFGACNSGDGFITGDRADPPTLQTLCAAAITARSPASVSPLVTGNEEWIVLPDVVGLVGDVTWGPDGTGIAVFDIAEPQVLLLEDDGQLRHRFGRRGSGPGEFVRSPNAWSGGARLLVTDAEIAVSDWRSTKVFDYAGRFLREIQVDSAPEAYNHDLHGALAGNEVLISTSGKYRLGLRQNLGRVRQEVRRVDLARSTVERLSALNLENSWIRYWPFETLPEHRPYRDVHRRTWDAVGDSLLAIYPWEQSGICFSSRSGDIVAAFSVDAPPLVVDGTERERVLRETFGDPDARVPFIGERPREMFADHWPTLGPRYTDVVGDPSGRAWALRRENGDRLVVDVYDAAAGYLGSFTPPTPSLPRRVRNDQALAAVNDSIVAILRYDIARP